MAEPITPGGRAKSVRKETGKTQAEMAEFLGVATGTWQKLERDEVVPSGETLMSFEKVGVNPGWVLSGLGPRLLSGQVDVPSSIGDVGVPRSEMIHLPQYDVNASAGRGEIAYKEHAVDEVGFDRRFLRNLGAQPEACFLMWAKGDSMLPTFPDGAMLIVDQSQATVDDGRIYVFNAHANLLVKRARWRMDGHLELASDNLAGGYPVEVFGADRVEDLTIVGRVVWYGRPV